MKAIERQTIVTWYDPDERKPKEGDIVVVTISGKFENHWTNVTYDHAFALAEWYENDGWMLTDIDDNSFTIHAWCDLVPYGSEVP